MTVPSREHRFLLACARAVLTGEREPDPGLVDGVDAEALRELAGSHGLLPLLGPFLAGFGAAAAPLRPAFRGRSLDDTRSALALTAELLPVVRRLEERGIPVAVYKGPGLALQAYGDPALRLFGDLDLLVPRAAIDGAVAALQELGFAQQPFASEDQRRAVLRDGHHLTLTRAPVVIELHWRFSKRVFGFAEALDGVWTRLQRLAVRAATVPVLAPEDHMLGLVMHASRGLWSVLEWTLAIAVLARSIPAGEWPEVARRAEAWGCARALQVSLLLSEALFATPAPAGLWARLPPDAATRALARAIAVHTLAGSRSPAWYLRTQVALRRGPLGKLAFLLRSLFVATPSDWAGAGGTRGGLVLARMARPFRLLRKYLGRKSA
ncbi:MAG TPA: nucleotidyltransferase family protein [Longimicrobium sp.]|nr:nucleotidyltransferase family protein [Longimicrobium sp.]